MVALVLARYGHLQTILASSPFRAWGKNPMCDAAREMIITTSGGVRLLGFYSPLVIHAFGGHNGFIDGFFLKSWYEQKLADMFDKISN